MEDKLKLGDWNLSDEREFMENLLCQRFNFFLVMFSLIMTAAFTSQSDIGRTLILGTGALLSIMVWLTIYRAHVKHHWIMQYLYDKTNHPAAIVDKTVKKGGWKSLFSVSCLIGIVIPLGCILVLTTFACLSAKGCF